MIEVSARIMNKSPFRVGGRVSEVHPKIPDETLTVYDSEKRDFSFWPGNRRLARRRTKSTASRSIEILCRRRGGKGTFQDGNWGSLPMLLYICLGGGIGRHKGLKIPWRLSPCGFDSRPRHHSIEDDKSKD